MAVPVPRQAIAVRSALKVCGSPWKLWKPMGAAMKAHDASNYHDPGAQYVAKPLQRATIHAHTHTAENVHSWLIDIER